MAPTPRKTIQADFISDLDCPICGQDQLSIKSLSNYPDFVSCGSCGSQFAVEEGGDRIMYGKIPATYPRTRRFALQQWAWPEAIARRASEERPDVTEPSVPLPTDPTVAPPEETTLAEEPEPEIEPEAPEDLPAPADSAPEQAMKEQPPTAPESAIQDEAIGAEIAPAEEPDSGGEFETALPEPPEEDDLPAPSDLDPDDLADRVTPIPPSEALEEEPMPGELEEPEEAEEPRADLKPEPEDQLPPPEVDEIGAEAQDLDLPAPEDLFDEDVAESPTPITPEDATLEEPVGEDFPSELAEEEVVDPPLPTAWAEEEEEEPEALLPSDLEQAEDEELFDEDLFDDEDAFDDFDKDDFSFFDEGDEASMPDPWEQEREPEDSTEGIFIPPFGEEEKDQEDPDFPSDFEPSPPMPDWLATGAESEDEEGLEEDEDDMAAIDFTRLRDEDDEKDEESSFGEEEDLLASLWGSEEGEEEFKAEPEPSDVDSELDDLTGLGAIGEAFHEGEPEPPSEPTEEPFRGLREEPAATEPPAHELERESEPEAEVPPAPEVTPEQEEIARHQWGGDQVDAPEEPVVEPVETETEVYEPLEPPPGVRYRVVLRTHQANFPAELCTHCGQSETAGRFPITASVYRSGVGDRQVTTFRVPLCSDCQERVKARSDEQQTARLQAHLISVLVALILVVSALAFRLVDFEGQIGLDLAILFLLAGMGYAIPAAFLLIRASRYEKPADAKYIETTMRIPTDTEGAETAFEFRNPRYAEYFRQRNEKLAVSKISKVRERQYEQE
ncbi:MAG: hypothetical protein ACLFWD_03375 [Anaerolineales bacterium]